LFLIDNLSIAKEMGELGYTRVINELSWDHEAQKYLGVYKNLLY